MPVSETPYLRLGRECPEYSWWRLPVGLVAGFAVYIVLTIGVVIATVVVFAGVSAEGLVEDFFADDLSTDNPWLLGLLLLSVAIWLPGQLLGRFACGPRLGDLMSVEGRLRVRWLLVCSAIAFVLYGGAIGLAALLDDDPSPVRMDGNAWLVIAVALVVVPFQATAEEVVFRGQLMQMVGAWTRWAWVPVVVSTPLFVAGHAYDLWGLIDVGVFGLLAALLTIRTGGLEAAMAAHVANNVVLFAVDAMGLYAATGTDYGPIDVLPTVVVSLLMAGAVEIAFRRGGLRRTRPRLPDPPPKVHYPFPPAAYYPPPTAWVPDPRWTPVPQPPHQPVPVPVPQAPEPRGDYPTYPGEIPDDWGRR